MVGVSNALKVWRLVVSDIFLSIVPLPTEEPWHRVLWKRTVRAGTSAAICVVSELVYMHAPFG